MGDFNVAIGETVQGVEGSHGLGWKPNDNMDRLVSFTTSNGMCITNTLFPHNRIHQTTWYPLIRVLNQVSRIICPGTTQVKTISLRHTCVQRSGH